VVPPGGDYAKYVYVEYDPGGYAMQVESEFNFERDAVRVNLNRYTRRAFRMLPETTERPRILDIGCGSGVPTIELARLTDGRIIGTDIDKPALDRFKKKVEKMKLADRIGIVRCSMFELAFRDESFDVVWSEGSICAIGFSRGLETWRRLIKPDGFLVVHDATGSLENKIEQIKGCGFALLEYFQLNGETWLKEYYRPLERQIQKARTRHFDAKTTETLDKEQQEVDRFKINPNLCDSVFLVMQKVQHGATWN